MEVKTDFEKASEVKKDWKYKLSTDDTFLALREKGLIWGTTYIRAEQDQVDGSTHAGHTHWASFTGHPLPVS